MARMGRKLGLIILALVVGLVAGVFLRPSLASVVTAFRQPSQLADSDIMVLPSGQRARFLSSKQKAPLIVDLHEWSQDETGSFGGDDPLFDHARKLGWHYIRPALTGPNDNPDACCSELVLSRVEESVSYAKMHANVAEVYVVGASGGGYTGLCALMSGRIEARSWSIWVPIVDLAAWYQFQRGQHYGKDILACTASEGGNLNMEEAVRRSPIYMSFPPGISEQRIKIYAGIEDGWHGSVPITHAISMFNRIARRAGHSDAVVSDQETLALLNMQYTALKPEPMAAGRVALFKRKAGNVDLVIFDGAHEGIASQVVSDITLQP